MCGRDKEREQNIKVEFKLVTTLLVHSVHTMCSTTLFIQVLEGLTEVQCTSMLTRAFDTDYETIITY